jgi:hypothetical protein
VDEELVFRTKITGQNMGVDIPEKERDLEKKQAGGPHRGGAAKPGQYDPGNDQFNLEHQERPEKYRYRE